MSSSAARTNALLHLSKEKRSKSSKSQSRTRPGDRRRTFNVEIELDPIQAVSGASSPKGAGEDVDIEEAEPRPTSEQRRPNRSTTSREHAVEFHILSLRLSAKSDMSFSGILPRTKTSSFASSKRRKDRLCTSVTLCTSVLTADRLSKMKESTVALTAQPVGENTWSIDSNALLQEETDEVGNVVTMGVPCVGIDSVPEGERGRRLVSLYFTLNVKEMRGGGEASGAIEREWYGESLHTFDKLDLPVGSDQDSERWIRMELTQKQALSTTPMVALLLIHRVGTVSTDRIDDMSDRYRVGRIQTALRYLSLAGLWLSVKAEKLFTWAAAYSKEDMQLAPNSRPWDFVVVVKATVDDVRSEHPPARRRSVFFNAVHDIQRKQGWKCCWRGGDMRPGTGVTLEMTRKYLEKYKEAIEEAGLEASEAFPLFDQWQVRKKSIGDFDTELSPSGRYFIFIRGSKARLADEWLRLLEQGCRWVQRKTVETGDSFIDKLSPAERVWMLKRICTLDPSRGGAGLAKIYDENVLDLFPLHDRRMNARLIAEMMKTILLHKRQYEQIKENFGEDIAFYFAFLAKYTQMLLIPAAVSFVMLVIGWLPNEWVETSTTIDAYDLCAAPRNHGSLYFRALPFFGIFIAVWGGFTLGRIKRLNFTLSSKWGLNGSEIGDGLGVDGKGQIRPEFVPLSHRMDAKTGEVEPYYPMWRRWMKQLFITVPSALLLLLFVLGVGSGFVLLQALITQWNGNIELDRAGYIDPVCLINVSKSEQDHIAALYSRSKITSSSISDFVEWVLMAFWGLGIGMSLNGMMQLSFVIALFLTLWENHKRIKSQEDALTKKMFIFSFITATVYFFIVGFAVIPAGKYIFGVLARVLPSSLFPVIFCEYSYYDSFIMSDWLIFGFGNIMWTAQIIDGVVDVILPLTFRRTYQSLYPKTQALQTRIKDAMKKLSTDHRSNALSRELARYTKAIVEEEKVSPPKQRPSSPTDDGSSVRSQRSSDASVRHDQVDLAMLRQAAFEAHLWHYNSFWEYGRVGVQFSYVMMMSVLSPTAIIPAVILNILLVRLHVAKLCLNAKRPVSKKVTGMGAWKRIFNVIVFLSFFSNLAFCVLSLASFEFYGKKVVTVNTTDGMLSSLSLDGRIEPVCKLRVNQTQLAEFQADHVDELVSIDSSEGTIFGYEVNCGVFYQGSRQLSSCIPIEIKVLLFIILEHVALALVYITAKRFRRPPQSALEVEADRDKSIIRQHIFQVTVNFGKRNSEAV